MLVVVFGAAAAAGIGVISYNMGYNAAKQEYKQERARESEGQQHKKSNLSQALRIKRR